MKRYSPHMCGKMEEQLGGHYITNADHLNALRAERERCAGLVEAAFGDVSLGHGLARVCAIAIMCGWTTLTPPAEKKPDEA
jgi:hypothetical protein